MGNCIQKETRAKRIVSSKRLSTKPPTNDDTCRSSIRKRTSTKKDNHDSHGPSCEDDFDSKTKTNTKLNSSKKSNNNKEFNIKKLEKLFDQYKDVYVPDSSVDDDPDHKVESIGPDGGLARFCKDLGIDGSEDPVLFVLAYHFNASDLLSGFKKEEFITGMQKLRLDSIDKTKAYLPVLRKELDDTDQLKMLYKWAFGFAKSEPSHKTVDKDVAIEIWVMLIGGKYYHVRKFVEYLKDDGSSEGGSAVKVINLDQWVNLLDFAMTIKDDFSNYDESAAWPCILDDYVRWTKESGNEKEDFNDGNDVV